MRRIKQIMGILLSWLLLIGIFQFMPIDIDSSRVFATAQSGDNSLSTLSISPGTLSPSFQYNIVDYTASVGTDVTSVEVNAKTSNETATIESVSGNTDLQDGENLVSIVVKAQNGTTATYKIVVTRQEGGETAAQEPAADEAQTGEADGQQAGETDGQQAGEANPQGITINGNPFNLAPTIPADIVPADFAKTTVTCQGQQVEGLSFEKAELMLVYLTTPSTEVKNTLAVYEEASNSFCPFRKLSFDEQNYLIILDPPAESGLSQEYTQTSQTLGEFADVPVFVKAQAAQMPDNSETGEAGGTERQEFSLIYGVSSYGNKGWYQYDALESTFQRYTPVQAASEPSVLDTQLPESDGEPSAEMQSLQKAYTDMEAQYNAQKDTSRKTTAVLVFIIAVLVVVIVNLLLRGRRADEDELEDEVDYDELTEKVREQVKSARKSRRGEIGHGRQEGDREEDLWEDDTVPRAILKQQTKVIPALSMEEQQASQAKHGTKADRKTEKKDRRQEQRLERKAEPKAERKAEPKAERKPEPVIEPDEDFEVIDLEDL